MFDESILAYGSDEEEGMKYVSKVGTIIALETMLRLVITAAETHTYKIDKRLVSFTNVSQHTR